MTSNESTQLIREAKAILDHADSQGREPSDFECGRIDAFLEVARHQSVTERKDFQRDAAR
jgi:hypothetical protein